ncbi:hypothetical protein DM02DRAFT_618003 [Periconia macrospinosa]|uniref:Rhodopsin domain-containing protein n=1 Tax=Periconia macrospinosa TaxID=97972 RepID=A0A2V1DB89_9PLEO|nr:hypothetical protein DM02DRAFT_618003 [Periconia macrospinosa]
MIIHPEGPGLTLLIVISVLLSVSTVAVALRVWARLEIRAFGLDDWLMLLGWALLAFTCIADYIAISYGLGAHASRLTEYEIGQGKKWFLIAGLSYAAATAPVKASICVLILRITPQRTYRWILYGVIVISSLGSFIRIVAYLARCQPLEAAWYPAKGKCGPASILTNVSYFFGTICILTDFICALLPALIIWKIQIFRKAKLYIGIMLALGVLASIATIIRMQYLFAYQDPKDYLYGITPIAIWSEVETCLGIVAGSLPTMRPLLRYLHVFGISSSGIGGISGTHMGHRMAPLRGERRTSVSGIAESYQVVIEREERSQRAKQDASDGSSQKRMLPEAGLQIYKERQYEVRVESKNANGHSDGVYDHPSNL